MLLTKFNLFEIAGLLEQSLDTVGKSDKKKLVEALETLLRRPPTIYKSRLLTFYSIGKSAPGGKTHIYHVRDMESHYLIGEVRWWGPLRGYVYFPTPDSALSPDHLADIHNFIASLMSLYFSKDENASSITVERPKTVWAKELSLSGFWKKIKDEDPNGKISEFLSWIDQYKLKNDWNVLFGASPDEKKLKRVPKFHELPDGMQLGLFLAFLLEQPDRYPFWEGMPENWETVKYELADWFTCQNSLTQNVEQ